MSQYYDHYVLVSGHRIMTYDIMPYWYWSLLFSFNDDKEIEFKIETETIKDWKIIAYTSPCNVCHYRVA